MLTSTESERVEFQPSFEVFDHSLEEWNKIKAQLPALLHEIEPDLFHEGVELIEPITNGFVDLKDPERLKAMTPDMPKHAYENTAHLFLSPDTTIILIKDGERLVGLSYAMPIGRMWPDREGESVDTAYIYLTGRFKEYTGYLLANKINLRMYKELAKKGVKTVVRDVMRGDEGEHNYSKQIIQELGDSIILPTRKHNDWGLGEQLCITSDIEVYLQSRIEH